MDKIVFASILVIFPFGQIFKFDFINFFDLLVLSLAILTFLKKPKYPRWYRYFFSFLLFCIFGLVLNYQLFEIKSFLYLLRFWSYSMIAVYIQNYYSHNHKDFLNKLLSLSLISAFFGWLQYLIWPDLTSLKYLGWDDHLLRMVGTFIDPTYLSLILILGLIIALRLKYNLAFYFLAFSVLFTYSRISYLLLFLITFLNKKYLALFFFMLTIILFLPKNIGEGTNFTRTTSVNNKLENYLETWQIFKKSPVYGIGFNNMCSARKLYLNDTNVDSHACNGADSSILFLLTITGVIGLILFINFISYLPSNHLLISSFLVVFVHSLQANSLFYPHIMFWLFSLIGLKKKVDS